jgi:esterase/lipase superfamily enzyme
VGFDLKVSGATAFFSWPSQGTLRGYLADGAAIEASEEAITRFLVAFARDSGAEAVHVVAHSMGNRGLLRALQRLAADAELPAGVRFGQVFLAAPDVDRDLFLNLARLYPAFSARTTLYASDADRAVATSAWVHASPRAGYFPPVTVAAGVDRLDTIVVPDFDLDLLGHGYFAQAEALLHDLFELVRHGTPPAHRQRLVANGGHWELRR